LVRNIQMSVFTAAPLANDPLPLMTTHLPGASIQSMDLTGIQKRVAALHSDLNVQMITHPARVDLHIFKDSGPGEPLTAEFELSDALELFKGPFLSLATALSAIRLALIVGSTESVETRSDAVTQVADKLHISDIPANVNEFEGRANSPVVRHDVVLNRNITWNVAEASLVLAGPSIGFQQQQSVVVFGQQVDVNSLPALNLQTDQLAQVIEDMLVEATSLVGKGIEALNG
jgi:hypothetical protein